MCQGLSFHGHDESETSLDKGNFLEMIAWHNARNPKVKEAFDYLCPKNARTTGPKIQKDVTKSCEIEISKVTKEEIGDNLFSVLIDESRDVSIAEQMAVIVRLVLYGRFAYLCYTSLFIVNTFISLQICVILICLLLILSFFANLCYTSLFIANTFICF
jgi:hypothetical protein